MTRKLRFGEQMFVQVEYKAVEDGVPLPFGEDRCVLAAVLHLALTRDDPVVKFESANEILKLLGMQGGGRDYERLRERLKRLGGLMITIVAASSEEGLAERSDLRRNLVFGEEHLPTREEIKAAEGGGGELTRPSVDDEASRYVIVSGDLWERVRRSRNRFLVPLELLRMFRDLPAAWDLLVVLAARCSGAQKESLIPHDALMEMFREGKEPARKVVYRLQRYLELIHVATGGRLNAKIVEYAAQRKPGKRGRPKKLWGLAVGPSERLVPKGRVLSVDDGVWAGRRQLKAASES
ncbi:MAG: hypothetical protein KDD47_10045 [Acidobacteria bacterium]|nr:hypothetical protein [Acidobacteriota bacterium]